MWRFRKFIGMAFLGICVWGLLWRVASIGLRSGDIHFSDELRNSLSRIDYRCFKKIWKS